jgi:ribosomal protein S18 acetylase RimI-like enzyme
MDFCLSASNLKNQSPIPSKSIPNTSVQIRFADLKDVKALADVLVQSFHVSENWFSWFYPLLKLGICEDLRTRLRSKSPYYQCLVALILEKEEVIGTAEISLRDWFLSPKRACYISNLAVSGSYRRQGIAKLLLLKCEKVAEEWNCEVLHLHVLEDNLPAKQLYLTNGYRSQRIENSLQSWLFKQPRRLLLEKKIRN